MKSVRKDGTNICCISHYQFLLSLNRVEDKPCFTLQDQERARQCSFMEVPTNTGVYALELLKCWLAHDMSGFNHVNVFRW